MNIRILFLTLVLQVLLVSCESTVKDTANAKQQNKQDESVTISRISHIPLRSEKTPRFIIRRSRPHLVTYNIVKTPLHTLGFGNRNDNGAISETTSTTTITTSSTSADESRPLNSTAAVEENKSKVAKVEKLQSKSDIISDYGSFNEDRLYQPLQYKSHPLYEYNTMHASTYQPTTAERVQPQKYNEAPKLEYLHAYQFADDQQDPTSSGQEFIDELEYAKQQQQQPRGQPQLQQQQQQEPLVEISKSKQYSYTIRKPEHSSFQQAIQQQQQREQQQQQLQQQHQPQQQALFQSQQQQPQSQYSSFGRETAYLKQTPSTAVPQQEEFKFQRINRPPVEKEVNYEEDFKPVHIHHHYPVQHTEEQESPRAEQQQQAQLQTNPQQFLQSQSQPIRSQYFPTTGSGNSGKFTSNQFQINTDPEPAPKQYTHSNYNGQHNHHQSSYIAPRKPVVKQNPWPESAYEVPTAKPPPKWENPRHQPQSQSENQKPTTGNDNEQDRPQTVYPKDIRIEIPEEEIYKHIQNSVHQIIREMKDKRTKDTTNRGKPLASQDNSWTKYIAQDENKKQQPRVQYNKTNVPYDPYPQKQNEKDHFGSENNASEKPRDQANFHQFYHQHQQPQHFHTSAPTQRINNRLHEEEKQFIRPNNIDNGNNNKFNNFRFEDNYSGPPTTRITDATQYENGYPREIAPQTVDITMQHPKKPPVIDLNALDVGQTYSHDSHFENQDFHKDHHSYFPHRPVSAPQNYNSRESSHPINPTPAVNLTNNSFQSTIQPFYDNVRLSSNRVQTSLYPDNGGHAMAYVGSAINVKDTFPLRSATPTTAFIKPEGQITPEPEVPEVDIMHGMLPVVNQFDNGNRVLKVILDPSKMPRELITDVNPNHVYQSGQPEYLPGNVQTIQYNMNHQHSIPIVPNQYVQVKHQQQQSQNNFPNHIPDQQNFISFPKERKEKKMNQHWANNIPEASSNMIQYLPAPPMPSSRNLLPYDSYSPIYNEEVNQNLGKALFHNLEAQSTIMRNKRHRGSEEFKKIIRAYPRNTKKVKTVKILEPATDLKPPPKYNKFNKKSSVQ